MPNFDNVDRFDHPNEGIERNEDATIEAIDPLREMYLGFNIIQKTLDTSGQILTRDLDSAKKHKEQLLKELESTNLRIATLDGRLNALRNANDEVFKASQTFIKSVEESDTKVNPVARKANTLINSHDVNIKGQGLNYQEYAHAGSLDSDGGIHFGRKLSEPS